MKKVLCALILSLILVGINTSAFVFRAYSQSAYPFNGNGFDPGFSGRFLSNRGAYFDTMQARYGDPMTAYRYRSWNGPFSSYKMNPFPSFQAQLHSPVFQGPVNQSINAWFKPVGWQSKTSSPAFGRAQSYGNGYNAFGRYDLGAIQNSYYLRGNSVLDYKPFSPTSSLFGSYGFGRSSTMLPGFLGYSAPRVPESSKNKGTGTVAVVLADGPADEYDHIYIWVTEVSLIPASGSSAPVTIFKTNKYEDGHRGLKVDLLEYRDEDYVMTVKKGVPANKYAKIRLKISAIETEGGPCDDIWIKLPSGKIDLNPSEPFCLIRGGTLSIRLDIDADKSINLHEAGKSGKCIFRPVVFVDIEEGAPVGWCPKIVNGRIIELTKDGSGAWTEGFILALDCDRGQLEVDLSEQTAIFDEEGIFSDASALEVGQDVKVRGKLDENGVLVASLVVIGDLLDLNGEVESAVDPLTNVFSFAPFPGQEFTDDQVDVKVQSQTLILLDCDTLGTTEMIVPGMKAQVFGKYGNNLLSAVTIILKERRVRGTITNLEEQDGGMMATIDEFGNGLVYVFIPTDTPIFLGRCKQISMNDLCTGQDVRVILEPTIADPLTAKKIFVKPERQEGKVMDIDWCQRTLLVDEDGDPTTTNDRQIVAVPLGAKILKYEKDDDEQKAFRSFNDIEVKDFIVYFGLTACQDSSEFNAFIVVVVDEYDDDVDDDYDCDYDDYLPRFVLENNVNIYLRAGFLDRSLTVRGNNFHLTGQAGAVNCGEGDWTVIRGDVEVYGNNATFTDITFLGTVRVKGNGVDFINCCFDGGGPIYSQ